MAKRSRQRSVQDRPRARVNIVTPVRDKCESSFTYDYGKLIGYSAYKLSVIEGVELGLGMASGTLIHHQRNDLAKMSLAGGYSHILWIDDDMRFPKDSLERLLSHKVPIVGVNYPKRQPPCEFTASEIVEPNRKLITFDDSTGLAPVEALGFGMVLMETAMLMKLPKPWFDMPYDKDKDEHTGEDVYFCTRARLAGYDIYVDHDLSKFIMHTGTMEYNHIHALDAWEHVQRAAEGIADATSNADNDVHGVADGGSGLAE